MSSTLARIREQRLDKVNELRKLGIDPYPAKSKRSHTNKDLVANYKELEGKRVTIVGRIMSWREHGQLRFGNILDTSGKIQIMIRKDRINDLDKERQYIGWKEMELLDIGDFIQAEGKLKKTKTGEISVDVDNIKILVKSIRPLPEKRMGLKDKETRFRRRYLEFASMPKSRDRFRRKAIFWKKARDFMLNRGFIEVETPILEHTPGGADARPFVTHHNSLDQDFYLRISSELFQKRLIGGGFEKVFVLGPNFRNEGIDDEHLQEFYQLEYYWAYSDIEDTIKLTKDLYRYLAEEVYGKTKFEYKNYKFDLADKWEEIDYVKVIKDRFNVNVFKEDLRKIHEILKKEGIDIEFENNRNRLVDNLWKLIRQEIAGPASLINAPKFISPLAKSYFDKPEITKRFQPIIAGTEVGNAYSELNDPVDQFKRFEDQQKMRDKGDDEAQMMDIDFVEMLEYGMPPTSCIGFSERLFWILENVTAREGTLFPQTKLHIDETTKEIYGIEKPKKITSVVESRFNKKIKHLRNMIVMDKIGEIEDESLIKIDEKFYKNYENVNIGIAIIKGVEVKNVDENLENLKKVIFKGIRKGLNAEDIDDIPQIESYFDMYKQMSIDTNSRKSSPEAMLRRLLEGDDIYKVNTCVDSYNLAVILTQVSAGAFDLDKLEGKIVVREAEDNEEIEIIGGEKKKLKKGEVCYFDKNGAYNIDYNYRDAERTKVTEKTKNIMVNVEGVNQITREQVADALKLTVDLITKYCGGEVELMGMVRNPKAVSDDPSDYDESKVIEPGITRDKALELIKKTTKQENLVKHMLASEAAVEEYAKKYVKEGKLHKDNVETWKIAGILHDVDFEGKPDKHWITGADELDKRGVSKYVTNAIRAHGNDDFSEHKTLLDTVLLTAEHSTGLVVTSALVLPSKKLKDLKVKSIVKKMKDKRFAAKIDRNVIRTGCEKLGLTLEEHFEIVLNGMLKVSEDLGL